MSHDLFVTDLEQTVYLSGGPFHIQEYTPNSPDVSPVEAEAWAMEDGGEVSSVTRRNVTEPVVLTVVGESQRDVGFQVNRLEALIRQAEEYQKRRVGRRVYVFYRPEGYADYWRSELAYGKLDVSKATMSTHWRAYAAEAMVAWRRRFYWEGEEAEVPLANGNGSGTGGRGIHNHDDGGTGHDNWVDVAGEDVEGVIPAPCRLEMENTYNDSQRSHTFWIGQNVWSDPSNFDQILEGEDAAYKAGGAGSTSSSTCSGGYYQAATWSGDNWVLAFRWVLSASLMGSAAGGFFRVFCRFSPAPTSGHRAQLKISYPSGTTIVPVFQAGQVQIVSGWALQDLGVLQLPPWLPGETDLAAVDLAMYAKKTGGGGLYVDFLHLTPLDGYRVLKPVGYGAAYQERLVDEGIADEIWVDTGAGTNKAGNYLSDGQRIHLWPGKDQRLYFLNREDIGVADIERTHTVRCYYRPRRLTL